MTNQPPATDEAEIRQIIAQAYEEQWPESGWAKAFLSGGDFRHAPAMISAMRSYSSLVRKRALEDAKAACREQIAAFMSPQYAVDQPLSSLSERFACGECERAIAALKSKES